MAPQDVTVDDVIVKQRRGVDQLDRDRRRQRLLHPASRTLADEHRQTRSQILADDAGCPITVPVRPAEVTADDRPDGGG